MQDHLVGHSNENEYQSSNLSPGNCLNVGENLRARKVGSSCSKAEKDVDEVKGQKIHLNFEGDNIQLVDLYEEDDHLIPFPYRATLEDLRLSVTFENVNEDVESKPRRQSFLRKSLAWDSAFLNGPGLLNPEELSMINKGIKRTQKDGQILKDTNKSRTAHDSKRFRSGGLPKSNSLKSPKTVNFNKLSSSASASAGPKRKMKYSALHMPSSKMFFDKELGSMQDHFVGHSNENEYQSSNLSPGNCLNVGENLRMRKVGSSCSKAEKDVDEVKGQKIHLNFEGDNIQLVDLYEEDDHLIPFPYRATLEDLRLSVTFENVNEDVESKPRRQSFLRKSLAWDSALLNDPGLLNPEEFFMIDKVLKSTQNDGQRSKDSPKIGVSAPSCKKMNTCSQKRQRRTTDDQKGYSSNNKVAAVEGVKIRNKTRTAHDSKRSRSGGLAKCTSPTTENFHQSSSSASSSSSSSKSLSKMNFNTKSNKLVNSPSSVLRFPLSSSPDSSVDTWLSGSSSPTTIIRQNASNFQGQVSEETKFISQNATKETAPGPTKSSGLRMPSPRIGFFDMEPRSISSNLFPCGNWLKVGKDLGSEHDEEKVGSGCSNLKSYGKIPKQILKMNFDQKDDHGSFHAKKESVCRQLNFIDLEKDVVQVGGQWLYEV